MYIRVLWTIIYQSDDLALSASDTLLENHRYHRECSIGGYWNQAELELP